VLAVGGIAVALAVVVPVLFLTVFGGGTAHAAYRPGIVLLDLKGGKQTAFVPPAQLRAPSSGFFSGGRFWLTNAEPNSFVEIDPHTGKIVRQFAAPFGPNSPLQSYQPYAVDGHTLWAADGDDLVAFETTSGRTVDRFHLDAIVGVRGVTEGVTLGGGLVWVSRDVNDRGQVVGLDPATGRERHRFDDVHHHTDIAYDNGILWGADHGGVTVINSTTGAVNDVHDITATNQNVVAGDGFGWTSDPAKGVAYKIDAGGNLVATYPTGLGAGTLSFSDGVAWVGNYDVGTVTGIDAITGSETSYQLGHPIGTEAAGGGVLLIALQPGATPEGLIAALPGRVAKLFAQKGELGGGDEAALNWSPEAFQIDYATCAKLLNYPDKAGAAGLKLQPEIAAAMPTLSNGGRTYTFTVRSGYRFSPPSNQPVTAETFRYSIERALSPKLGGFEPAAYFVDDIAGEQAFLGGNAAHISGLQAKGNRLSITLTKPSPDFLERLALPFFCPVPLGTPFVAGGPKVGGGPYGGGGIPSAGPYYIANANNEVYVILKRNPNYHGPRLHSLDEIALREGVDASVAVGRVERAGWDGVVSSGENGPFTGDPLLDPTGALASKYRKAVAGRDQYVPVPLPGTGFLALNASRGPFSDPVVRRAATLALDRTAIASIWGQLPTAQLLPAGYPGVRQGQPLALAGDPAKGKALLRGPHVHVVMATFKSDRDTQEGQAVRAELGLIGISVRIERFDNAYQAANKPGARIDILDSDAAIEYPDSASFLANMLSDRTVPTGWLSSDVVQKVDAVSALSGAARQPAAAALAQRLAVRDVPVIAYGNRVQGEFFSPKLGCRVFPPMGYGVDLAALCLK
jgi:peptide/nickel transport system substrate-binding protein